MMKTVLGYIEIYQVQSLYQKEKWHFTCCVLIGDGKRSDNNIKLSNGFSIKHTSHIIWESSNLIDVLQAKTRVKEEYADNYIYINTIFPIDVFIPELSSKINKNQQDYRYCFKVLYPKIYKTIENEVRCKSDMTPKICKNLMQYYKYSIDIYQQSIEICEIFAIRKIVAPHPVEFFDKKALK